MTSNKGREEAQLAIFRWKQQPWQQQVNAELAEGPHIQIKEELKGLAAAQQLTATCLATVPFTREAEMQQQ